MENLVLSEASQAMKERHVCLHLTYTNCLNSMVETKRLEDIKALKIIMDTREKVEIVWEEKSIRKEIWGKKQRGKTFVGHRYGLLFVDV